MHIQGEKKMFDLMSEMLSYPFLQRALIVGILVSLCSALLGTSLVLKRYSMIGDGLSHMGFAAFLLLRMNENSRIKGDAATALMCSGALAVGVMTISLTTGMNTDVCNYMFGSILAMSQSDVIISVILSIVVIIMFVAFYPRIFAVTFDENFSKATGVNSNLYNMIIAMLTAVTVVLGMRMMGTLLISSLIVFPSLSAMRIFKRFSWVVIASVVIAVICFCLGVIISYIYSTPTGASIVIINIAVFMIFAAIERFKTKARI